MSEDPYIAGENSEVENNKSGNQNIEIKNMEVHHHPHVEKKNFKEYFLEFLMIFLAVTMGCFAENIREHFVEERQQKEYVLSFYEDLKTDSANISTIIDFNQQKLDGLKNVSNCYDTISMHMGSDACLEELVRSSISLRQFQMTARTIKELSNAGGYRLLAKEDADSITQYEAEVNFVMDFQSAYQQVQDNLRNITSDVISFKALRQMHPGQLNTHDVAGTFLYEYDGKLLNKYFNELFKYSGFIHAQSGMLKQLKNKQVYLINYFKKKYKLQ